MPTVQEDIAAVKHIHDEWWAANADFDIPRLRTCFVKGDKLLQYNLNGHTYNGIDELATLWALIGQNYGIPEMEVIDMRIEVRGDMAWVSHEALIRRVAKVGGVLPPSTLPGTTFRVRETEVLIRDDGDGNKVWKIWHHHCSTHAPDDQIRTGFQDSVTSRKKKAG
jgi:ketosteroid isomerase-like protein